MRAVTLLMLIGCSSSNGRVDECGFVSDPCITFHLTAAPAIPAGSLVTAVAMWVTFNDGNGQHNQLLMTKTQAPTPFPIAVGLDLPVTLFDAPRVRIEALNGPGVVAYKVLSVTAPTVDHQDVDVIMEQPDLSGCFDGKPGSGESDVDCGGNTCLPCDFGRRCFTATDCRTTICSVGSCQ
jgi:hypothetical protein